MNRPPADAVREGAMPSLRPVLPCIWLTGCLLLYSVLPPLVGNASVMGGNWIWLLIIPNGLLLAVILHWMHRHPEDRDLLRGGRFILPFSLLAITVAAVLVLAFLRRAAPRFVPASPVYSLALVLVVPGVEEVFFRGMMLRSFKAAFGTVPAILAVSMLFGLMHAHPGSSLQMMVFSLVLCVITLLSGSVLWAISLHVAWNAAAVLEGMPAGSHRLLPVAAALYAVASVTIWAFRSGGKGNAPDRRGPARTDPGTS